MQTPKARLEHPFDETMQQEVTGFLFNHYRVHFQSRPALAEAYACIPQVCRSFSIWNACYIVSHRHEQPCCWQDASLLVPVFCLDWNTITNSCQNLSKEA